MKYVAAIWLVFTIVVGHGMMENAFTKGFEQGYVEGRESVEMTEQEVFMQCTKWWFDGSEPRAKQAMNQYCDRRIK